MKETSITAYKESRTKAASHRKIILAVMEKAGKPMSSLQISTKCELTHQQVWKRMSELEALNKVKDSKHRATNPSGKPAVMYQLCSDQCEIEF